MGRLVSGRRAIKLDAEWGKDDICSPLVASPKTKAAFVSAFVYEREIASFRIIEKQMAG